MRPSLRPKLLLLAMSVFGLLPSGAAAATPSSWLQPFSAEFMHSEGQQTSTGKIFGIRIAVRIEVQDSQRRQNAITILRLDRNESHTLIPAAKSNMEVPYAGAAGGRVAEFAAYVQGAVVQRKPVGVEKVSGYECDKYLLQVTYEGRVYSAYEWAARELHGFAVKREGERGEWSTEYLNIRLGPQEPSLFEVPSDYKTIEYSKDWTEALAQLYSQPPSEAVETAEAAGLKVERHDISTDYFSTEILDPVTGENVLSADTILDRFPGFQPANTSAPGGSLVPVTKPTIVPTVPKVLAVKRSDVGSQYHLDVSFVVPDVPDIDFQMVQVYGMQMESGERSQDQTYKVVNGHWKPNDVVQFSVSILKDRSDASKGWILSFCVGSNTRCWPSPNLLSLMTPAQTESRA